MKKSTWSSFILSAYAPIGAMLLLCFLPGLLSAQEGPEARGSFPRGGANEIIRNAFISVLVSGGPLDSASVSTQHVKLYPIGRPEQAVPAFVIYREDLRNITLEPFGLLLPKTGYTFEISSGVTDKKGNPFKPYIATFNTGEKALRKMISMDKGETFGSPPGVIPSDTTTYIDVDALLAKIEAQWAEEEKELRKVIPAIETVMVPNVSISTTKPASILVATKIDPIEIPEIPATKPDLTGITLRPIQLRSDAFDLENELSLLFLPMVDKVSPIPASIDPEVLAILLSQALDEEELPSDEDLAMGLEAGENETTVVTPGLSAAGRILFENGSRVRLGQSLEITFDFELDEYVTMKLRTYDGKVVLTEKGWVYPGRRTRFVKITRLAPGTYYAVFESESFKTTRKVVITP
ncbi:MAG: Ig-like domain-containing protein [Bacteroidia bacterium]